MCSVQQSSEVAYIPILQIPILSNKFIKKIRKGFNNNSIFLLHEDNTIGSLTRINNIQKEQLQFNLEHIALCQTVLYDTLAFDDKLIISCRDLPIRILEKSEDVNKGYQFSGSIGTKKKNSQLYETPIEISKFQLNQHNFIGGGKKFAHVYDINRLTVQASIKKFNKKHISSLNFLNHDYTMLFGEFDGTISLFDFRDITQSIATLHIHFDAITHIVPHPLISDLFVTSARKDDYKYLWDRRKMATFVQKYRERIYGNQRVGVDILSTSKGQYLIGGNEFGKVNIWQLQSGKLCDSLPLINNHKKQSFEDCVGAIYVDNQNSQVYFGIGGRSFNYKDIVQKNNCSLRSIKIKFNEVSSD